MQTIDEIRKALSSLPEGSVIFVDVDDTLITPKSVLFHAQSPYRALIDELKKNRDNYLNFDTIISRWRLRRKSMLVSQEWPMFIRDLQEKYPVYALTKMETGAIGDIPSMQEWRYQELTKMGFVFTPVFGKQDERVLIGGDTPYPAVFYRGIFITGAYSKGEVMKAIFAEYRPSYIVLIDDRIDYIQDVEAACRACNISCLGIHYTGMDLLSGSPVPEVAEFQKRHLLENAEWLEDEEAMAKLQSLNSIPNIH